MSTGEQGSPADLEEQANATREEVDRTLDALEDRLSVKRRVGAAAEAIGIAAGRASRRASPEITTLIRLDHTHVLAAFRRFHGHSSAAHKQAVVANVCLALEVHAQLEEEIFYPAVFGDGTGAVELDKSVVEHEQMRVLMQRLRQMTPRNTHYDETFYELIRTVLHHVADEETLVLPLAETKLKGKLRELGWRMTVRRIELVKPYAADIARTSVQTFPILTGVLAAGVLTASWLLLRAMQNRGSTPRFHRYNLT
jgi:hypothetical protein